MTSGEAKPRKGANSAPASAGEHGGDDEDDQLERPRVAPEAGEPALVLADGLRARDRTASGRGRGSAASESRTQAAARK